MVSREEYGYFGRPDGNRLLLDDIHRVTRWAKALPELEGLPWFLLGHSMGSFYARQYLCEYGGELQGAILMGTGWQPRARRPGRPGTVPSAGGLPWVALPQQAGGTVWPLGAITAASVRPRLQRLAEPGRKRGGPLPVRGAVQLPFHPQWLRQPVHRSGAPVRQGAAGPGAQRPAGAVPVGGTTTRWGTGAAACRRRPRACGTPGCAGWKSSFNPGARHELLVELNRQEVFADIGGFIQNHIQA